MTELVIFDCDGVLVDSENSILNYYDWILKEVGSPEFDWSKGDMKRRAYSMTDRDILAMLAGEDKELLSQLLMIAKTKEPPTTIFNITLHNGVREILQYLYDKKMQLAVVSNRGKSLPRVLEYLKIDNYFGKIVTAGDVKQPKPAPDGVLSVLSYFDISADKSLFIGDSETDYFAGKSSKVRFLSYRSKLHDAKIIQEFEEIKTYL